MSLKCRSKNLVLMARDGQRVSHRWHSDSSLSGMMHTTRTPVHKSRAAATTMVYFPKTIIDCYLSLSLSPNSTYAYHPLNRKATVRVLREKLFPPHAPPRPDDGSTVSAVFSALAQPTARRPTARAAGRLERSTRPTGRSPATRRRRSERRQSDTSLKRPVGSGVRKALLVWLQCTSLSMIGR